MRWHNWLRHCATSWKVTSLIPNGVTGIFRWHNPSGCIIALGLTQPLTEMSTRNISWRVKAASAYSWHPYHLQVLNVLKSGSLTFLETSGHVQACDGTALPFLIIVVKCWLNPRFIVRPKGICQWNIPVTPSGIKPATFRIVAQCLNQLRHRVPLITVGLSNLRHDIKTNKCM
jgi:hypothetical protein